MDKIFVSEKMYHQLAPFFNPPKKEVDPQAEALEIAEMPADTKKLIAAEYLRLRRIHPKWKLSKTMRKAGEKYNVKFEFE